MRWLIVCLIFLLSGCGTTPANIADGSGSYAQSVPLVGAKNLQLTPGISLPLESKVYWGLYVGAAYLILDPLAPNWRIEEAPLGDKHVHFSLKMKRYYAGGAGEARQIFQRRAKELALLNGFDGFRVVEYSESLDSSVLGSQRTAEGVVILTRKAPPG